ncbi:MAG: 2,3-bisphosphoglycerate-independent phosphoglycerate mutase [Phascolarctobacterium sp.]|nr:2,3-bisphosphoglycerate-independent phosphoglycerate mutase [Phascolarctobacterium sp.]MBQ7318549.1 2,3-bisphosphoglycerate-independent phosphoglycerate mutase [Phascolarctobacterium sp.]
MSKKPVMLMILDGWGIAPASDVNAAYLAQTPNLDRYFAEFPHTTLEASGLDVGLPEGQIGNSEVGHLNIGAGRIIYQSLTRITKAIKDGDFFTNKVLCDCMDKTKEAGKALHLLGLLSDGGVHSNINHLIALLEMAKARGVAKVYVHAFLDGRDVAPKSAVGFIEQLQEAMAAMDFGKIATVMGRYYAMDRDKRWDRVEKAYRTLVYGEGKVAADPVDGVEESYEAGVTDEFVEPFVIEGVDAKITAGDGVIFFNFRPDRARQITRALNDVEFPYFERSAEARPVNYVCMTQYDATIDAPVAYPPESIDDTLGQVLAKQGMHQLRIAETEKYAHVTFFFNGGVEEPNPNEERILIASPKVATYDLQPEMSAYKVTDALLAELDQDKFDVVILNYANPDMVGHTGVLPAAIKAMEAVDECVGKIVEKVLGLGGSVCITADHGNLEKMAEADGTPHTAHTTNIVPFVLVSKEEHKLHSGILADIAPTMLELLNIEKPAAMTGSSLIEK